MILRSKAMHIGGLAGIIITTLVGMYVLRMSGQVGTPAEFKLAYSLFNAVSVWVGYKVGLSSGVYVNANGFSVRNFFKVFDLGFGVVKEIRLTNRIYIVTDRGDVEIFSFSPSLYGDLTKNRSYFPYLEFMNKALERGKSGPRKASMLYQEKVRLDWVVFVFSFNIFFTLAFVFDSS